MDFKETYSNLEERAQYFEFSRFRAGLQTMRWFFFVYKALFVTAKGESMFSDNGLCLTNGQTTVEMGLFKFWYPSLNFVVSRLELTRETDIR